MDFNPTWLIELAKAQKPEAKNFHTALEACTKTVQEKVAYIYFISPKGGNKPGSPWQYSHSVELECPKVGSMVVDMMKDGRVGGIEFIDHIPY